MVRISLALVLSVLSLNTLASQDPTAPLGWQKSTPNKPAVVKRKPVPKLQSIVCEDTHGCSAIINGQVVLAGEQVSGYKVSQIKPEVVTLVRGGKQWKLNLFSLDVKQ